MRRHKLIEAGAAIDEEEVNWDEDDSEDEEESGSEVEKPTKETAVNRSTCFD